MYNKKKFAVMTSFSPYKLNDSTQSYEKENYTIFEVIYGFSQRNKISN